MDIVTDYKVFTVIPNDTLQQLTLSIEAMFKSWNSDAAFFFRELNDIEHGNGMPVIVQSMVYGNISNSCGTGHFFTRNLSSGSSDIFGAYQVLQLIHYQ